MSWKCCKALPLLVVRAYYHHQLNARPQYPEEPTRSQWAKTPLQPVHSFWAGGKGGTGWGRAEQWRVCGGLHLWILIFMSGCTAQQRGSQACLCLQNSWPRLEEDHWWTRASLCKAQLGRNVAMRWSVHCTSWGRGPFFQTLDLNCQLGFGQPWSRGNRWVKARILELLAGTRESQNKTWKKAQAI